MCKLCLFWIYDLQQISIFSLETDRLQIKQKCARVGGFKSKIYIFRPDGHQNNLRSAAYGAIMEMVKNSPKDCYDTVLKTTYVIMERIHALLQMEVIFSITFSILSQCVLFIMQKH